jgi:hypothetical protein
MSTADELRAKRDLLLGPPPPAPPTPPRRVRKFAVSVLIPGFPEPQYRHYLIEAEDREDAQRILDEELGNESRSEAERARYETWAASDTFKWRSAWRHTQVEVLRATTVPAGIE